MSVATAGAAVSTQQHQPTQEQIRLAQLIDDKKHNQPEVQEIIRKVLDVVEHSNQEDALVALFDCDYDYEKAVALLIEKGHDVASEWRTATNHKLTKKQQQQKGAATKNGHEELNENGQQRGNNTLTSRGKSRGGRPRFPQNGGDSQNNNHQQQQQNDNDVPQQRQRGGSGYRGRYRGNQRGGFRGTDRNYQQQQHQQQQQQQTQDSNLDTTSPSDTNRRSKGAASTSRQQEPWDVGNWNGETLIISRTTKDDEQPVNSDNASTVQNGQSDATSLDPSKPKFDPIEAARQIKDVIGIGQAAKPSVSDQQQKSKPAGQPLNTKVTPSPPAQQRIPQQPVIFSDRFDGGVNKIDVQFGNLGESFDETASSSFYQQTQSIPSNKVPQQRPTEQSTHISPSTRPSEQPVMSQQRILLAQMQQPAMTMKPVVASQYAVHQQQHQANPPSMLIQSLLYHHQQPESVALDTSYDPNTFSLPSLEFNSPYFMAAPMSQPLPQQQTQPRYIVPQPHPTPQQTATKNVQTPSASAPTVAATTKKAPTVPPGMFPPTAIPPQLTQGAYSTPYGVQQGAGGPTFSAPYDPEHLFSSSFMPLTNPQQAQSPSGGYGSVTPPVQQQNQQQSGSNNNDSKVMNFRAPVTENLILLQQLALQQSNSQQAAAHSPALNYFLGHPPSGSNYSPGPQIMYAPAAAAMNQQQQQQQFPKQQGQQYNQHNSAAGIGGNEDYYGRGSSSASKDGQYMYATASQPQHGPAQSAGQQQGANKQQQQQQQQRTGGNVYNNQQGQQRPFQ